MENIIIALITGAFSVIAVVITNMSSNNKMQQKIEVSQAVTDTKIDELTREVREHNNFAKRMPSVEAKVEELEKRIIKVESKVGL